MEQQYEGVLLTVAYEGTLFSGWAPQPNARTVAGELLNAIRAIQPEVREVRGASRTDAGVHARGQKASFDALWHIPPRGWVLGLKSHLPGLMAVRAASRVPPGFTPRFRSKGKRYIYTLLEDELHDPFWAHHACRVHRPVDLCLMRQAACHLLGTHDCTAFRGSADQRENTLCTLSRMDVTRDTQDARVVRIFVEGDRFLYHMVRIIAGTLIDIGHRRLASDALKRALTSRLRADLGRTAPAHGLMLDEAFLEDEGTERWPDPPMLR